MKAISSILWWVCIATLSVVLVCLGIMRIFDVKMLAVQSSSMEPDLPLGSLVVVFPTPLRDIRIGDDVSYVADETLTVVTHRITTIDNKAGTVTTRGIAGSSPSDAVIPVANTLGVVKFCIPKAGDWLLYFSTPYWKLGAFLLVIIIAVIVHLPKSKPDQNENRTGQSRPRRPQPPSHMPRFPTGGTA